MNDRPAPPLVPLAPLVVIAALLAAVPGLALGAGAAGNNATSTGQATDAYRQQVEAWRQDRLAGLKREDGWLTLVGLFWLEEGENRFGSGAGNRVVFPAGTAPEVAGSFARHGRNVRVKAAPGAALTHDGKPVAEMALTIDPAAKPTVFALGSLRFFVIQRGDRLGVRVKDTKSPALAAFRGIDEFPIRPDWRIDARFEPYDPPKKIAILNILNQTEDSPSPGAVIFERNGKTYRLDALPGGDDGELFLLFADETNGHETYHSGRFLSTSKPKDGRVEVDFNEAYNPPCVFTPYATCPIPPKQNRLALRVEAGEKMYGAGNH